MPGSSIGISMNFGFGGTVSRLMPAPSVESKPVASDSDNIVFGTPVVLNSDNTFDSATSTTITAANFAGVALRVVQQDLSYPPDNTAGFFAPDAMADVVQQGYVLVNVGRGTPTAGGAVYVRTALDSNYPDSVVSDWEAAPSFEAGTSELLTNCCWATGIVDANGMAELKLKTINN